MSFHEIKFPSDISYKAKGGPEFKTEIVQLASGYEKRNILWQYSRAKYEINYEELSKTEANRLLSFFMSRRGKAYGFRFKDWNDFEAKEQLLGSGDGLKTSFSLIKNYDAQGETYQRKISKPVEGTISILADSSDVTNDVSIDYATGIITFQQAPALGVEIKATFEFHVPVRFETDYLSNDVKSFGKSSIKKIELIELKI